MAEFKMTPEETKIHSDALLEFDDIQSSTRDQRQQALQERRFYSIPGAQWDGPLGEQFEDKPKIEVNKVHLSVIRIFSEARNNGITVDFISKDGTKNENLSDLCDKLYRADEQDSVASEAYDNAFEEAVGGGMGAWRMRAVLEDEFDDDNDNQRIRIEPIYDADTSVFFNLNAKRQDKSDAKRCFVITAMSKAAYEAEYDDDPVSWPKTTYGEGEFNWYNEADDIVFVCELYRAEEVTENVQTWVDLAEKEEKFTDEDFEDDPTLESVLLATGWKKDSEKKVRRKRIRKYIMSGNNFLEPSALIAGPNIPIIVEYGKRWFVDNKERFMGHVRLAMDTQRLKNMQESKLAEISALSTVSKPIFTPQQIGKHGKMWSDDNIKNYPYLLVDPVENAAGEIMPVGPVAYTKAPEIPQAMAALLQITDVDLRELLGNQEAGETIASNIAEGTVALIQDQLGMQSYIYISNKGKAVQWGGTVWLGMAQELYTEKGRMMKVVSKEGEVDAISVGTPMIDEDTDEVIFDNDLSKAKLSVTSSVGPSSSSAKKAMVKSFQDMVQVTDDPETRQVLTWLAIMNMEGEGIDDAQDFFRKKLLAIGAVEPTKKEAQEMQEAQANAPPDSNTELASALSEEALANARGSDADTVKAIADADKSRAQTQEILAGIDLDKLKATVELFEKMQPQQAVIPEIVQQPDDGQAPT